MISRWWFLTKNSWSNREADVKKSGHTSQLKHSNYPNLSLKIIWTSSVMLITLMCDFHTNLAKKLSWILFLCAFHYIKLTKFMSSRILSGAKKKNEYFIRSAKKFPAQPNSKIWNFYSFFFFFNVNRFLYGPWTFH